MSVGMSLIKVQGQGRDENTEDYPGAEKSW